MIGVKGKRMESLPRRLRNASMRHASMYDIQTAGQTRIKLTDTLPAVIGEFLYVGEGGVVESHG